MLPMGTKAHYFDSTLKFGGAKYRPTGRGFVMIHEQVISPVSPGISLYLPYISPAASS
jgi:hypothetical protein